MKNDTCKGCGRILVRSKTDPLPDRATHGRHSGGGKCSKCWTRDKRDANPKPRIYMRRPEVCRACSVPLRARRADPTPDTEPYFGRGLCRSCYARQEREIAKAVEIATGVRDEFGRPYQSRSKKPSEVSRSLYAGKTFGPR